MSVASLLVVVRDKLKKVLTQIDSPDQNIRLGMNGQPIPTAGGIYLAVHLREWTNPDPQLTNLLKQETGLIVTISIRSRRNPEDRDPDQVLIKASKGLTDIAELIMTTLHGNTALAVSAGRIEPLRWTACMGPNEQFKDWYRSVDPNDGDAQPAGYSMEVIFTGAGKITAIGCGAGA
jgi:hypothetical protein